jgi:hypothetical protein
MEIITKQHKGDPSLFVQIVLKDIPHPNQNREKGNRYNTLVCYCKLFLFHLKDVLMIVEIKVRELG